MSRLLLIAGLQSLSYMLPQPTNETQISLVKIIEYEFVFQSGRPSSVLFDSVMTTKPKYKWIWYTRLIVFCTSTQILWSCCIRLKYWEAVVDWKHSATKRSLFWQNLSSKTDVLRYKNVKRLIMTVTQHIWDYGFIRSLKYYRNYAA